MKLGFGLMRLPKRGVRIDVDETAQMVDLFLEAGGTYFDTAHVYVGSEGAIAKALVKRHPRESYTLATKLFAGTAPTAKAAKKQFDTSLARTGAGYFDYYLLHCLMKVNYRKYDRFDLWDFAVQKKREGLARHIGFSFHSGPKLLDWLLSEHPEVDFVQLQINYADWEDPVVQARANYEVARAHDVPIVVMEPLKGGRLANPPKDVARLLQAHDAQASCASWGIRFAASLPGVMCVLSGMSDTAQMCDNLSYMKDFRPLDADEQRVVQQAQRLMGSSATIPCTACRYCVASCPQHIPIPDVFAAMNKQLGNGLAEEARADYAQVVSQTGARPASACIACGQCERNCPQHLPIINDLKKCVTALE